MSEKQATKPTLKNTIRGWDFTDSEILNARMHSICLNPSIDLTNVCNLNCHYCFLAEKNSLHKERKGNELTLKETFQVIAELKDLGARTINIVGAGEPTVDCHFKEVVEFIASLGMITVLFTNGIKFAAEESLVEFCYAHNTTVILKCNSRKDSIQDGVAGRVGYNKEKEIALKLLLKHKFNEASPTRLGIDTIVMRGNLDEIPALHRWGRDNNVFPLTTDYIPCGRTLDGKFTNNDSNLITLLGEITSEERSTMLKKVREIDNEFGIGREENFAYFCGGKCTQLLGIYITIEGQVFPCVAKQNLTVRDKNGVLGNIRDGASIKTIWEKNKYLQSLRNCYTGGCPYKPTLK